MKKKDEIMAEFDQAIKSLKEWVEGKPIEDTPEWVKVFDEKYGSFQLCEPINKKDYDRLKDFIRTEVIEKLCHDIWGNLAITEIGCFEDRCIKEIQDRWLGGKV